VLERIGPDAETDKRLGGLNGFMPADRAAIGPTAAGTYIFLFKAVGEGEGKLQFGFFTPGGPWPVERSKSYKVAELAVTVKVVAGDGTLKADLAWGKPVNGLRLGIKVNYDFVRAAISARVVLQNVSDKPVLVLPLLVRGATVNFTVTDPDGQRVRLLPPMIDWDVPDYDKAVKTLAPNELVPEQA